jgi:hypothetical protein
MPPIGSSSRLRRASFTAAASLVAVLLAGCSTSTRDPRRPRAAPGSPTGLLAEAGQGDCQSLADNTIGAVAKRIYEEVASGPVIREAMKRTRRSARLLEAVREDDPVAAHRALAQLNKGQLVRAKVLRGSATLSEIGGSPAIAPARETLRSAAGASIGTVVISTQGMRAFVDTLHSLTGAQVLLSGASAAPQGTTTSSVLDGEEPARHDAYSFTAERFPAGRLRATLEIPPPPAWVCADSAAQTVTNTIGLIAKRIYHGERAGEKVTSVVRGMQSSPGFVNAVADQNAAQTRASIIGFFRSHLHVVRVRVTVNEPGGGQRLLIDVGGPHVLAPVRGTLRLGGRVIGHFLVAIQDDTGYLKLVHLFTTAQVLLRPGRGQPIGTLAPNPALSHVPASGSFAYHGSTYEVYSFNGKSFPSGPLQISLLLADS